MNNTTIRFAGEIQVEDSKRGLKFFAFNHQHGRRLHIGTLSGTVYEKVAVILRQPEPSLCLTQSEFTTIQEAGGQFIRFVVDGATYAISLQDFSHRSDKFYLPQYGYQMRVALRHFQFSNTVAKRTARTDNPVIERGGALSLPIHKPAQLPLPLFGS